MFTMSVDPRQAKTTLSVIKEKNTKSCPRSSSGNLPRSKRIALKVRGGNDCRLPQGQLTGHGRRVERQRNSATYHNDTADLLWRWSIRIHGFTLVHGRTRTCGYNVFRPGHRPPSTKAAHGILISGNLRDNKTIPIWSALLVQGKKARKLY